MEGECKLVWLTDDVSTPPDIPETLAQHSVTCHNGKMPGQQTSTMMAAAVTASAALAENSTDSRDIRLVNQCFYWCIC